MLLMTGRAPPPGRSVLQVRIEPAPGVRHLAKRAAWSRHGSRQGRDGAGGGTDFKARQPLPYLDQFPDQAQLYSNSAGLICRLFPGQELHMQQIQKRAGQTPLRGLLAGGTGLVFAAVAGTIALSACQTKAPAPTGNLLTAAGFTTKVADTPARQAKLAAIPAGKMMARQVKGKTVYVFADPKGCNCVYIGDETAYQSFRQLGRNRSLPSDQSLVAEMNSENSWDFNSIGPGPNW
ncbi:hypothetical protein ACERNI_15800 [Camelimonas sp. ID_303_24]